MVKKISTLALAGLLALPAMASAGAGGAAAASDIQAQVDALTRQLEQLKSEMAKVKAAPAPVSDQSSRIQALEEKSEQWDLASRIQFSGDFRSRYDYYTRDRKVSNVAVFTPPGAPITYTDVTDKNDGIMTNRFRLDMRAKALENVEFKGRLAMYKAWGMQSTPDGEGNTPIGSFPAFDGNATRTPGDSTLQVDRAFVNWNNIGDSPVWFSVGRRPTTDGPAAQLRMNQDERMATPTAFMDWPFDGISVGYAYNNLFGVQDAPGRVRICYGRGFEAGLNQNDTGINDTDFAGVSWDVYKKGDRFAYVQSFAAMDVFNYPDWSDATTAARTAAGYGDAGRKNLGNIYHTSGVYQDKWQNLNYFLTGAWSRTDPNDQGMLNDYTSGVNNTNEEDGFAVHIGVRYDIPDSLFKVGAEYNHGSKYWIAMSPGHDDLYASKLATRGNVYELYTIYDIPGGEAVSKFGKAFIRLGYQHYDYNYTGSMDWNVMPYDVGDANEAWKANFAGQDIIESADQVYLTFEASF
ncbi:MAG: DUF3373 family protein [Desulfurivibrionaceae bacterium]|jgi:hypothetical protein|nr:DUF3373 domain-containing protein [Pseudomonadota bacterium]MCG2823170.1 DUF3373 domain-containing protein [Desulfobulbaceae bacterium]MDP2001310.1 DUF3373 family protein [Desulfurivibrionaceae bacterium]MBU4408256.1 DUF3373 domain-containing protein [Pseudomonadota bacterium]MBU4412173.1 DUF3373 domain-containing protein [Pseudomonadota bacterium]